MSTGFKPHYFEELAKLESENFWFRSRNRFILWAMITYSPRISSFLEIGCGTGFVISAVSNQFPGAKVVGSEYLVEGLAFARQRLPNAEFSQMDARDIPYEAEFDSIGAFDVLEHIEEDEAVLAQICKALRPNGMLFITVPQHQWMWSAVDEYACHVRRYSSVDVHRKVERVGFEILRSTSFVSTLLPVMYLSRLLQTRKSEVDIGAVAGLKINRTLNKIFEWCLSVELMFVRFGISFPIGGSRLIVARKKT